MPQATRPSEVFSLVQSQAFVSSCVWQYFWSAARSGKMACASFALWLQLSTDV